MFFNDVKLLRQFHVQHKWAAAQGSLPVAMLLVVTLSLLAALHPHPASASQPVAEITMVIGKAHAIDAEGKARRLHDGDSLAEGERIETAGSGHVHLRFIDDARVSVRPRSRLTVTAYDFDPAAPEQSAIRFDLEHGIARSISGRGAENARERFRFNTPLAAIGVRGTDFQVQGDAERVRVMVNEGAIVMSAFSDSCLRDALSPCLQGGVILEGATENVLELLRDQAQPQLLQNEVGGAIGGQSAGQQPRSGYSKTNGIHSREEDSSQGSQEESPSREESRSDDDGGENGSVASKGGSPSSDKQDMTAPVDQALQDNNRLLGPDDLLLPPQRQQNLPRIEDRQLTWGHWDAPKQPGEFILPYLDAADGRVARVRARGLTLFRDEPSGASLATEHLGNVSFRLDRAAVSLRQGLNASPMEAKGGTLNIHFGQQQFSTALDLDHEATGPLRFLMRGDVTSSGMLIGVSDNGALVGAGSLDGREAAYYFQEMIEQGQVEGTTLWGSQ